MRRSPRGGPWPIKRSRVAAIKQNRTPEFYKLTPPTRQTRQKLVRPIMELYLDTE